MRDRFRRIAHRLEDVIHDGTVNSHDIKPIDPALNTTTCTEINQTGRFEPENNVLGGRCCCDLAPATLKKHYSIASNLHEEIFAVGRRLARNIGKYSFHRFPFRVRRDNYRESDIPTSHRSFPLIAGYLNRTLPGLRRICKFSMVRTDTI